MKRIGELLRADRQTVVDCFESFCQRRSIAKLVVSFLNLDALLGMSRHVLRASAYLVAIASKRRQRSADRSAVYHLSRLSAQNHFGSIAIGRCHHEFVRHACA
jgi:hypothetical protein